MKKSIKRLLSAVLTVAIVITALPSVIGAGAVEDTLNVEAVETVTITDPRTQPEASVVCPPGYYNEADGRQHLPVLPIVVGFKDLDYNADYNWSQAIFGDSNNHITLNENETANNADSLQEYFRVMSHDKFVLDCVEETEGSNDGVVHVTLPYEHWDSSSKYAKYYEYYAIEDAMSKANQFVDISGYDTDGLGIIENNELMVAIIFAGYDTAAKKYSSIDDPAKMSSAGYASFPLAENDGEGHSKEFFPVLSDKQIKPFITCPESRLRNNNSDTQTSFGVLARAALMFMGLPNYLGETGAAVRNGVNANEWGNFRTNYLSPMARNSGVYVNSNGSIDENRTAPYSLDPWAKIRLGWAQSEVVNVPQGGTITKTVSALDYGNIGSQETILRVNIPGKQKEYYLIENRQSRGYDAGLKYDHRYTGYNTDGGIIVWHIDESVMDAYTYDVKNGAQIKYTYLQDLKINDTYHHPAITPVYLEYDNSVQEKSYNFKDNTADYHTGLFTADWLSKYGLSKIDLMSYTGSDVNLYSDPKTDIVKDYSDRVGDRRNTNISIEVPENSDNMEINITFPDVSLNPNVQPAANKVCAPGMLNYKDGKQHLPVLVIVAGFKDLPFKSAYNWSKSIFGDDKVSVNDNGVLINGDSLQGYFHTMSHGNLVLDPVKENEGTKDDGVIHVTLDDTNHWECSDNSDGDEYAAISKAINKAVNLKDKDGNNIVDISQYDVDGSGTIENNELLPIVLFAGYDYSSKSLTSDKSTNRFFRMSQAWCSCFNAGSEPVFKISDDKFVKIPWHITSAENRLVNKGGNDIQTSYGSIAHEALHYMGIPDYYASTNAVGRAFTDTYEWDAHKVQCLSPMGRPHGVFVYADKNGNPVTNTDRTAAYSLDPWAKIRLGWATCKVVDPPENGSITTETIKAYDYNNIETQNETILRVNVPGNPKEYYLIENRQFKGYDKGMKYDPRYIDSNSNGGIVVWHIDESVLDAYTYAGDNKPQNTTRTYLQSMVINDAYHHPAIMPVFIENNHSSGGKDWNFLGYNVNFRTGIHSSETLGSYGLSRIHLTKYTGSNLNLYSNPDSASLKDYSDRVGDREYTGISVEPSESKHNMTVIIRYEDYSHPLKMKAIYFEKTANEFPDANENELKKITPHLYAFEECPYKNWPGIKMDPVRDNIYVAYVPCSYNYCYFNDGGERKGAYTKHDVSDNGIIYSNGKWSLYKKAVYVTNPDPKLSTAKRRGDANLDNILTIKDVTKLQRYLSEYQYMSKLEIAASDTDINGWINVADITNIQSYIAEFEMKSPVNCNKEISKICV